MRFVNISRVYHIFGGGFKQKSALHDFMQIIHTSSWSGWSRFASKVGTKKATITKLEGFAAGKCRLGGKIGLEVSPRG